MVPRNKLGPLRSPTYSREPFFFFDFDLIRGCNKGNPTKTKSGVTESNSVLANELPTRNSTAQLRRVMRNVKTKPRGATTRSAKSLRNYSDRQARAVRNWIFKASVHAGA